MGQLGGGDSRPGQLGNTGQIVLNKCDSGSCDCAEEDRKKKEKEKPVVATTAKPKASSSSFGGGRKNRWARTISGDDSYSFAGVFQWLYMYCTLSFESVQQRIRLLFCEQNWVRNPKSNSVFFVEILCLGDFNASCEFEAGPVSFPLSYLIGWHALLLSPRALKIRAIGTIRARGLRTLVLTLFKSLKIRRTVFWNWIKWFFLSPGLNALKCSVTFQGPKLSIDSYWILAYYESIPPL